MNIDFDVTLYILRKSDEHTKIYYQAYHRRDIHDNFKYLNNHEQICFANPSKSFNKYLDHKKTIYPGVQEKFRNYGMNLCSTMRWVHDMKKEVYLNLSV